MSEEESDEAKPERRKVIRIESEPMPLEDLPDEFTNEWLGSLRAGQLIWLEEQRDSLSESQRKALTAYIDATFGETIRRLQAHIAKSFEPTFAKLAEALARPNSLSESFIRQEEATKRLVETLRPQVEAPKDLGSVNSLWEQKAKRRAERDRRERALIELTATVADSTRALAQNVRGQEWLTWVLATAVLFDIIHGTFEDSSVKTTLFSFLVAAAIVIVCAEVGRWAAGRRRNANARSRPPEASASPQDDSGGVDN
jgi:hypothetical protein